MTPLAPDPKHTKGWLSEKEREGERGGRGGREGGREAEKQVGMWAAGQMAPSSGGRWSSMNRPTKIITSFA